MTVDPSRDADVRVDQLRVDFPATYLGAQRRHEVRFTNVGGKTADVTLTVEAPFAAEPNSFSLERGADQRVVFTFAPTTVGVMNTTVQGIELFGEGLAIPECSEDTTCTTSRFDGEQCVEQNKDDGTSCETNCITGQCNTGTCIGNLKGCATNDACLVPTCDERTGCGSTPRMCPEPSSPCQVATCDSATGCGITDALDGTLCGADDCFATQVNVCVTGQCVLRPRPVTARCSNRWVPDTFPARSSFSMTWDATRGRAVVFGGQGFQDTWLWNGAWEQRLAVSSPSRRARHGTTWDPVRKRVLLFGGADFTTLFDDTWEWDGTTWLRRTPMTSPPAATAQKALAWDHARRRAVLFLGAQGTWEWDGSNWSRRATSGGPPGDQPTIAWDGIAQRVVLFGGITSSSQRSNSFWEWNGSAWLERPAPSLAPSPRFSAALSWDSTRRRLVLVGGVDEQPLNDTWEWDGVVWAKRTPMRSPRVGAGAELTYDEARQRTVLKTSDDDGVWEWDGNEWTIFAKSRPPLRREPGIATDSVRRRVIFFGGRNVTSFGSAETWSWDGVSWTQLQPVTSPTRRSTHAMSYDPMRERVVLFGGIADETAPSPLDETWEFDGATWLRRTPSTSPPTMSSAVMAWDAVRQRTVLFGGQTRETWSWDGTTWLLQQPTVEPTASVSAIAWDGVQQRLLLQNTSTWSWDGTDWAEHQPSPPLRFTFAMASDVTRNRVIYVVRGQLFTEPLETWEWNGVQWSQLQPVTPLPGGLTVVMTWDPVRQRVMAMLDGTVWHFLP